MTVTEWAVKTHLENICTLFGDMKCNVNKNNYLLQILVNVTGLHQIFSCIVPEKRSCVMTLELSTGEHHNMAYLSYLRIS